jgi:hypothetical protein
LVNPETLPVFLNGHAVHVRPGTTLGELVTRDEPALGAALASGAALATDARGIAVEAAHRLAAGEIFRVFQSARAAGPATDA